MELKTLTLQSLKIGELLKLLILSIWFKLTRKPLPMLCMYEEYSKLLMEYNQMGQQYNHTTEKMEALYIDYFDIESMLSLIASDYGNSAVSRKMQACCNRLKARNTLLLEAAKQGKKQ